MGVLTVDYVFIEADSSLVEPQATRVKPRITFFRVREGIQFIAPNVAAGQIIQKGKKACDRKPGEGVVVLSQAFFLSKCPDHYIMSLLEMQCEARLPPPFRKAFRSLLMHSLLRQNSWLLLLGLVFSPE